ncbi:MAG: MMPL family transporter [Hyphomicrobiales bacterium]
MFSTFDVLISQLVHLASRKAKTCLLIYLMLIGLSIFAAVSFLGVNTDSSKMLSSALDFQQKTHAFNKNFPSIKNSLVIVIRSEVPDAADEAALKIVEALKDSANLTNVFSPAASSFFKQNGLLYKDEETLESELDQLNKSASLLASLRETPTFDNFFHSLFTAEELAEQADFDRAFLDDFYIDVAKTIEARQSGNALPLSWAKASGTDNSSTDVEGGAKQAGGGEVQRLLYATPVFDFTAIQPAKAAIAALHKAIDELDEDIKALTTIGVTGDPALRFEELKSVSNGIALSLGLSFLLVAVLLWVAFRSTRGVALTFVALISALILTTGFAAAFFGDLNLVSVAFIVLLVGLGLDFTIHALAHLGDENQETTVDTLTAMGRGIGGALLLSALTTALAFLSFAPTDFVGMAQLGILGAVGVLVAFTVSVTMVPALIVAFPWFERFATKTNGADKASASGFAHLVQAGRPVLATVLVLLTVAALFVISDVRFDADPVALRDPDSPSMKTLGLLHERVETAPYRLSLMRSSLEEADKAAQAVEALDTVHSARTLSSLVPENQDEKFEILDLSFATLDTIATGEGLENASLPEGKTPLVALSERLAKQVERPAAIAFSSVLAKLSSETTGMQKQVEGDIFRFFPALIKAIEAQLLVDFVTLENVPDFFKQRFIGADQQWRVDIVPNGDVRDGKALDAFVQSVEQFDETAAGAPLQIANAGKTVSKAMALAVGLAAISILIVSFIVLRQASTVLAIIVPLIMAGLLTGAASVIFAIPFNYANVIVLPLLIGLGVDSGIHIATRRERSQDSAGLYQSSTPWAVLFSGLTTIAAFATLGVSDHRGTASMGQMLAIAIFCTLMSTIVITPLIIDIIEKFKKKNI